MKMTIEKAISWLVSITEHEGEDIPIYDDDVKAINMAIEIMHRYQKIQTLLNMDDSNHRRTIKLSELKEILIK